MKKIIDLVTNKIKIVQGIKAIALIGSYSFGNLKKDSDIDFALFYRGSNKFDFKAFSSVIHKLSDFPNPFITEIDTLGKLSNGKAWVTIKGKEFDFFYWDIDRINIYLGQCSKGLIQANYNYPYPYGFYNFSYLRIISDAKVLYDPDSIIDFLKNKISKYPYLLKKNIIKAFLFDASRNYQHALKYAKRKQLYMFLGCVTRVTKDLIQILYALNKTYFSLDKQIYFDYEKFDKKPPFFLKKIENFLTNINSENTMDKLSDLKKLIEEVTELC